MSLLLLLTAATPGVIPPVPHTYGGDDVTTASYDGDNTPDCTYDGDLALTATYGGD